tara:strand:+ start:372 stop:713 length:342 start_codon:yes stop_codon:yes gene_type:complete
MSIQITRVGIVSDHADTNLDGQPLIKFTVEEEGVANLRDISDIVSTALGTGIGTNFILSYDPNADNFIFISPDNVVDSAVQSNSGAVGFSTTVINQISTDLDNKIDLDAGTWS